MNTDERLQHYFDDRSADVSTSSTPIDVIVRRGRRRRRRRDATRVGALAGAVALAGVAAAQGFRGGGTTEVDTAAETDGATAPKLDWTFVDPERSIGSGRMAATASDGSVYELSTAPGTVDDQDAARKPALYRSTDEQNWDDVALPVGLSPNGIATGSDRIYAVGTQPAGGGVDKVTVASTANGSDDWTMADVELDLAGREVRSGLDIEILETRLARLGDATVVAVSTRATNADLAAILGIDPGEDWMPMAVTPEGIEGVVCREGDDAMPSPTTPPNVTAPPTVDETAATSTVPADAADDANVSSCVDTEIRPWSDFDGVVSAEQRYELVGETAVVVIADDGSSEPVHVVPGAFAPDLVVDSSGVWLSTGDPTGSRLWHAPDGRTWTAVGQKMAASVIGSGVVDGRARFAAFDFAGTTVSVIDTATAEPALRPVPLEPGWSPTAVAFGPLGAVVGAIHDDGSIALFHSRDLVTYAAEPIDVGPRVSIAGISVTADAVTVRLADRTDLPLDAFETPSVTRLYVGTPD